MSNWYDELIPEHLRNLEVYQSGKPIDELKRERGLEKITKLASNENPLGPSPKAVKEMTLALWDIHRYPDQFAYKVKTKLAEIYQLKNENIILGNGSEGVMAYISRTLIQPGDEILTSEGTFIGFTILARSSGAKLVQVPLTKSYRFDVEKLAEAITPKTKIIYIANPNNPTGTYINEIDFDYLMDHVPERVLVVIDEAYYEFAKGQGDYPDSMRYRYDNVITLRTFSKAYGISGVRVGYGFAHHDLIKHLAKAKLPFAPNSIAQAGAYGALNDQNHLRRTLRNNLKRYDTTFRYLKRKGFNPIPSITNFITFHAGGVQAAAELCESLLNHGVIIRHLKGNNMPDFVRVSLGLKHEMEHFYEAMDEILPEFLKKHQENIK